MSLQLGWQFGCIHWDVWQAAYAASVNVQLDSCSYNCDRAGTYIQTHPLHNKTRKCIPKDIFIPPVNHRLANTFSAIMELTYRHHQAGQSTNSLRAANQGKQKETPGKPYAETNDKKLMRQ